MLETVRLLVQNLIVIVVLAVFLEMLLPVSELRRYVKMVMGLLIIITVLQTAAGLAKSDWLADLPEFADVSGPGNARIDSIIEDGKKFSEKNRQQAIEEYKEGIARQVSALAGLDGKVSIVSADVEIQENQSEKDYGQIKKIKLVLGKQAPETAEGSGIGMVQPVTVNLGDKPGDNPGQEEIPPELSSSVEKLSAAVANFYNLPPERVNVVYQNNG